MQKLKTFLKGKLLPSFFLLFLTRPAEPSQLIKSFLALPASQQAKTLQDLSLFLKKASKHDQIKSLICLACLLQNSTCAAVVCQCVNLDEFHFDEQKQSKSKSKVALAEDGLANFIIRYLQGRMIQENLAVKFTQNSLLEQASFGNYAQEMVMEVQKYELFIRYLLAHPSPGIPHDSIKALLRQVFGQIEVTLSSTTKLVTENIPLIFSREKEAFLVNQAYEKLLRVNQNLDRLEKFGRSIDIVMELPRYQVNLEMNRQIEREMLMKKEACKEHEKEANQIRETMGMRYFSRNNQEETICRFNDL